MSGVEVECPNCDYETLLYPQSAKITSQIQCGYIDNAPLCPVCYEQIKHDELSDDSGPSSLGELFSEKPENIAPHLTLVGDPDE